MEIKAQSQVQLEVGTNGDGESKVLYCPLCRARGIRSRMHPGKVLIRAPHAVLHPRPWFTLLRRSPLRRLLAARLLQRLIARHQRWFYRVYFAPYRRVEGYVCEAVPSHGLTKETYLKAIIGNADPHDVLQEMEEIRKTYREYLWSGV